MNCITDERYTQIEKLANYVKGISYKDLPDEVKDKLKLCIIDGLECCISPMTDGRGYAAFKSIHRNSASCTSTLFCTGGKGDAADAAFYNTVKGAITSRNDTCLSAGCHPGSILIPVTFALAEERTAGGKAILESLLAGYETMIRIGKALNRRSSRSWRSTALSAPVGAAFAAAKMAELDAEGIASAASFSCHSCGGINEWAVAGTGEDVFQNGWGARNGIFAMRLAEAGAIGCKTVLEGSNGLFNALGVSGDTEKFFDDLGKEYHILQVIHKPIDSCYMVQNPAQTAAKLLQKYPEIRPENINEVYIEVTRSAKNYPGCSNNKEVNTLVQGIMSIALGVASTLFLGSCESITWAPPIEDNILDLMRSCHIIENEEFTKAGTGSARVTVQMKDGKRYSEEQKTLRPLTKEEVYQRFKKTSFLRLGKDRTDRLLQLINDLDKLENISEIAAILK